MLGRNEEQRAYAMVQLANVILDRPSQMVAVLLGTAVAIGIVVYCFSANPDFEMIFAVFAPILTMVIGYHFGARSRQ